MSRTSHQKRNLLNSFARLRDGAKRVSAANQTESRREFLRAICDHSEQFMKNVKQRRVVQGQLARGCRDVLQKEERMKDKVERKAEKNRVKLLKQNDIEGYRKLLDGKKTERLR